MVRLAYSAWFENALMVPSDQDFEWVAISVIEAETPELAKQWGDHLARDYSLRNPDEAFVRSEVRALDDPIWTGATQGWHELPQIKFGYEATADEIGW